MSNLREQLTLWFLRRFQLFRTLERRAEHLATHSAYAYILPEASVGRLEVELLHALLLHTHCHVDVDVLPTQRVGWLAPGQVRARLFEGGGDR